MATPHVTSREVAPLFEEVLAGISQGPERAEVETADPALAELFESETRTTA